METITEEERRNLNALSEFLAEIATPLANKILKE